MVPMFALTMEAWGELSETVILRREGVALWGRIADRTERAVPGVIAESMSETTRVGKFLAGFGPHSRCPRPVMLNLFQHPSCRLL